MKSKLIIATFSSGSTYLQRSATVWLRNLHDPATVNPHELLNGIGHHPNGYLIKKWQDVNAQSTSEIQHILTTNTTPIVARLSYDHMLLRNESPEEIQLFYNFLNKYFDVYISRRDNLFDYGLCWAIRRCTNRDPAFQINNVHTPEDRVQLYGDQTFYVDPSTIVSQAQKYLDYLNWADINFPLAYPVYYHDIETNIDNVLQKLFPSSSSIKDQFGLSIAEYTMIGYNISNNQAQQYTKFQLNKWAQMKEYLLTLCEQQVLLDSIPIKSTNIQDKLAKVENMPVCIDHYNQWANNCDQDVPLISAELLHTMAQRDIELYRI